MGSWVPRRIASQEDGRGGGDWKLTYILETKELVSSIFTEGPGILQHLLQRR
jgi:hypothetical protein